MIHFNLNCIPSVCFYCFTFSGVFWSAWYRPSKVSLSLWVCSRWVYSCFEFTCNAQQIAANSLVFSCSCQIAHCCVGCFPVARVCYLSFREHRCSMCLNSLATLLLLTSHTLIPEIHPQVSSPCLLRSPQLSTCFVNVPPQEVAKEACRQWPVMRHCEGVSSFYQTRTGLLAVWIQGPNPRAGRS